MIVRRAAKAAQAAALFGLTVDELANRDASRPPLGRWVAFEHSGAVGVATAFERADGRVFVTHRLTAESAFAPLLQAALDELKCTLHVSASVSETGRIEAAKDLGFVQDFADLAFEVPIEPALAQLDRIDRSSNVTLVAADRVDPDMLFALDIELRNDIPGLDGWRGNRQWFDDEMGSDDFDPNGYWVAQGIDTQLIGLCRFWRDPAGPKLGMLGVTRSYRSGVVATALLRQSLTGVAGWGWPAFSAHTARLSLQRRLRRLGAAETGGSVRFIHPA